MPNDEPSWDDTVEVSEPTWDDTSSVTIAEVPKQTGALGTRFRPSVRTNVLGGPSIPPSESLLGISPDMVPSGAGTKVPWLSIPASVVGKTAAGVAGYLTSPQGATETALAATPAAPVIFAKWAYDMARSGYDNVNDIVKELGGMARDAFDKGIINANQLGPVPQGQTIQDHIQSLLEKSANAALMTAGAGGAASHALARGKALIGPRTVEPPSTPAEPIKAAPAPETPTELEVNPTTKESPPAVALEGVSEPPIRLSGEKKTAPWPSALINKDPSGEGWRLTWFSEFEGKLDPRGHDTFPTRDAALSAAKDMDFTVKESPLAAVTEGVLQQAPSGVGGLTVPASGKPIDSVWKDNTKRFLEEGYGDASLSGIERVNVSDIASSEEHGYAPKYLVDHIKKGGALQPVVLERYSDGSIHIVDGSNRVNAALEVGVNDIPAKFVEYTDRKSFTTKAPPTAVTGEVRQPAPSVGEAKVGVADTTLTEPAKAEVGTEPPTPQAPTVTPPVTEPLVGLGGAEAGEIPETGAGGEKYGVAERIRAERAKAGQVELVEPGKGMSTQATIEMGREIVRRDPEAPDRIMSAFESDPKKAISTEGIAVVRAHGESLAAGARNIEDNFGTESPEYQQAKKYLSDWDKRSKTMQTEWHKQGMAQQGETDIDTGSYTGLQRARQQATGKDIPEPQKPKAKKIAKENKDAQESVSDAAQKLNTRIRENNPADAEKAAIDAANKTVREAAAQLADSENKARVAQAQRDKDIYNVQAKNAKKALEAAQEVERGVRERALKEQQKRANDPSIAVWELANKYLDENKGIYSFDDLRNKIAADLKMSPSMVTHWLSRDATTKRLAVDLWNKQRNARRLKEQAKIWLRELDTPGYQKALMSVPNAMFSLSVFGHGFVALGTHAPIVAFQPRFWGAYVRNFGKMYKLVFSPAYYESQMQDLVRRPNYEVARRAGLQNDPFKYEEFHTTAIRDLVKNWIGEKNMDKVDKFTSGGNRGYSVLKLLRQDMFDQRYDNLPGSIRVQEGVLDGIADGVNHATGVTEKAAPQGSNILLFAPRLAGSRVMWLGGDPARAVAAITNWKNTTEGERQFAKDQMKEKAWVFGTFASLLAMNQGFLTASGSKQKINGIPEALGGAGFDPMASDFLKFKVEGMNVAYGGALLTMAKLPVRVATGILYEGKGSKYVLEDERAYKALGSYIRSQMSPFAGTVSDLSFGRDYEERPLPAKMFGTVEQTGKVPKRLRQEGIEPYTWPEFAATKLPIPIAEGIREGLKGSGMNDEQANYWMKAWAITSIMTGTGTRITEDTREE